MLDILGEYMEFTCKFFGYDKLLPMNTGAEAVETALKLCRRWGYRRKGVAPERAKIVVCSENFHGRTITIISMSTDPSSYADFGPYTARFIKIPYNKVDALAEALKDPDVVGFLVEPTKVRPGSWCPAMVICGLAMIFAISIMCCLSRMRYRQVSVVPVSYWLVITRGFVRTS